MNSHLSLKMLRDFRLPRREIGVADWRCAIDADTEHQGTAVLMRERNQISVAQHDESASGFRASQPREERFSRRFQAVDGRTHREPVGADTLPLLDQHSVGFEET